MALRTVSLLSVVNIVLGDNPWYCHDLDCPPYTALKNITENGQTIEIRNYPAQLWVSTTIENEEFSLSPSTQMVYYFLVRGGDRYTNYVSISLTLCTLQLTFALHANVHST